jgi:hypothetical protein
VDGVLESVDHEKLYLLDQANGLDTQKRSQRPHEEWIYYGRPLCDGEQVSFEFYQEAERYSIQPTIDRIAVRLDSDKLRQHWITSDVDLYGVSSNNQVDAPEDSILGKAQLKEMSWNEITLRREGDIIIIALNDQDIYQQTAEEPYNGRFGFLQVPEQFQVRVRNAILTGDWPEILPQDLFEEIK